MKDEIHDEVYAARKKVAEQCDYDFKRLIERYEQLQTEHPKRLVSEVPKSDPGPLPM